jgi:hypothetical protein
MNLDNGLLISLVPVATLLGGWVVRVETRFSAQEKLLAKIDTLVDLLLQKEMSNNENVSQKGGHPRNDQDPRSYFESGAES